MRSCRHPSTEKRGGAAWPRLPASVTPVDRSVAERVPRLKAASPLCVTRSFSQGRQPGIYYCLHCRPGPPCRHTPDRGRAVHSGRARPSAAKSGTLRRHTERPGGVYSCAHDNGQTSAIRQSPFDIFQDVLLFNIHRLYRSPTTLKGRVHLPGWQSLATFQS